MPYFDFTCRKCGLVFEECLLNNERAKCPSCGSTRVDKEFPTPKIGNQYKKAWDRRPADNPIKVYIKR